MNNDFNKTGIVSSLQLCPGYRKPMQQVESVEAIENLGLKGDKHALPDSTRQVLLIEKETLNALDLSPSIVKENITTEGIALMKLQRKQRLKIGEEVIFEITKACSPCNRMDEIRPGLLRELSGRRGMLARVIRGGTIHRGDPIEPIGG